MGGGNGHWVVPMGRILWIEFLRNNLDDGAHNKSSCNNMLWRDYNHFLWIQSDIRLRAIENIVP